jgi:hypothetical protein
MVSQESNWSWLVKLKAKQTIDMGKEVRRRR